MASPIRWDNINGANLGEASRPLEAAQRSFLGAFDTLGNTLQQRQTIEDANWQNTKNNNTTAFLDRVAQFRSPEELRAAQESGALDQLRQSFGSQVDANAIRGAADARTTLLQQQAAAQREYDHATTDERTAPLVQAFRAASLKGDTAAAQAAQDQYTALGGRNLSSLLEFGDQRAQQVVQRGRDTTMFDNQVRKASDEHIGAQKQLQVADANIRQSNAGVAASNSQVSRNQFEMGRQEKLDDAAIRAGRAEAAKAALKSSGNLYADGIYNGSQSDELLQTMTKNGIGSNTEQRTEVIRKLNQLQKDGIEITTPDGKKSIKIRDLPLSAVTAAINSAYNPFWVGGWNSGVGSQMETNLKEILKQQYINADGSLSSRPVEDLAAFQQTIQNARNNAPGILPQRQQRPKQ